MLRLLKRSFPKITLRLALVFFSLLFSLGAVKAQGVGSSRGLPGGTGRHTIKGRVFTPSGRPYQAGLKVRLDSDIAGSSTTNTDPDGVFIFNNLPAANYAIVIDAGPNFDAVRESTTIYGTAAFGNLAIPQTINLPINLREKGRVAAAATVLNAALANVPKQAVELFNKARESASKGDHKKAVEQLNAALAVHSAFSLALSELGVQYLKLAQPDKAAESLRAALKLSPNDISVRLNYGVALLNQKKFDEAETQLREVLRLNDAIPTAHMYLGITLMNLKKLDDAESELQRAVSSKSAEVSSSHRYLGGIYWGKRDYKRAADELELYLTLVPKAPDAERTRAAIKELREKH